MTTTPQSPLLVFTDLDGSLLDHVTYDYTPAMAWLKRLKARSVPLIINTSKTAAEVMVLHQALGLGAPFITENGAAIYLPAFWCLDETPDERGWADIVLGESYRRIRSVLEAVRNTERFRFRGFGDFSIEEVAEHTGLKAPDAELAHLRDASEPLIWEDSDEALERFQRLLIGAGLSLSRGGRFYHVLGDNTSKGRAIAWLVDRYHLLKGQRPLTVGLGDGPNDVAMLESVDRAVLIRGEHNLDIHIADTVQLYTTTQKGPAGWSEGLDHWLG
ncbi:HAD-IIB family hydrolase [Kushneria sp. AK178]